MEPLEALQKRLNKCNGALSLRGRRKTMDKRKKNPGTYGGVTTNAKRRRCKQH